MWWSKEQLESCPPRSEISWPPPTNHAVPIPINGASTPLTPGPPEAPQPQTALVARGNMGEMARILVGTTDGIHEGGDSGRRGAIRHPGRDVTAVAAGIRRGLTVSPDGGDAWTFHDEGLARYLLPGRGSMRGQPGTCLDAVPGGELAPSGCRTAWSTPRSTGASPGTWWPRACPASTAS
jgi:hypothetical protein